MVNKNWLNHPLIPLVIYYYQNNSLELHLMYGRHTIICHPKKILFNQIFKLMLGLGFWLYMFSGGAGAAASAPGGVPGALGGRGSADRLPLGRARPQNTRLQAPATRQLPTLPPHPAQAVRFAPLLGMSGGFQNWYLIHRRLCPAIFTLPPPPALVAKKRGEGRPYVLGLFWTFT